MDRAIRDKWTAALRSGEYLQGHMLLRTTDQDGTHRYCCLGVLCDLRDPKGWDERNYFISNDDAGCASLTQDMLKWAGIDTNNGLVPIPILHTDLAHLNDNGMSFARIAEVIEKYL